MRRHRRALCFFLGALCFGCREKPAEPEHDRDAAPAAAPAASHPELRWTVPPAWNVEKTADRGLYRAKYTLPAAGDAKHEAEVLVQRLGTGPKADPGAKLTELAGEFEGSGSDRVTRERFSVRAFEVEWMEVAGAYRFPMGPPVGPKKKAMAHVIKEDWRALAAGVRTKDRGNWLFRMVGPSDSVSAGRSAFRAMIDSLE